MGITLYKLIPGDQEESSAAAKKTLIMIGASDGILLLGIALIWKITGELDMSEIALRTDSALTIFAFLTLSSVVSQKQAPSPSIHGYRITRKQRQHHHRLYCQLLLINCWVFTFLARTTHGLFEMTDGMKLLLLSLGAITIIGAVFMALNQHNYKRLLGFHAVSQVGYMILGFGLGSSYRHCRWSFSYD